MSELTRWEGFSALAFAYAAQNPQQREGQAWFNALTMFDRNLADEVHGTDLDPFHHDERLPALQHHLQNRMDRGDFR